MFVDHKRSFPHFRRALLLLAFPLLLVLSAFVLVAARRSQAQPSPVNDWRFGIVETYESPTDATAAGAAWTRVRFHWGDSQPNGPDEWLPPVSDEQLAAEIAAGREVTGMLIGTPDWARGQDLLPRGLWLEPDDPANLWANYVRMVVSRYRGQIKHWVIWNEPDIWDKEAPGHTWDGEVEDYLQLHKTAYLVAKQENPESVIHLAAFTYFWDANYGREQYFNRFLDLLMADPEAPDHGYYFDAATAHLYFQPNLVYDIIQAFREMMAAHGLDKPIWLMETNAPPHDDVAWPVESPTLLVHQVEQAAFMPQVLAVALAAGAERVAVFKLQDTETDRAANPEPFGLVRLDGSRRPAFETFQTAVRYLSGAHAATRERWDEVGQIRVDQAEMSTTVLFARLPFPQQADVAATAATAVLVSMTGEQQRLDAENGFFTVELPPALCAQPIGDYCMIGGETYFLVQAKAGTVLPASLPAPALSPTEAAPPAATPEPAETPLPPMRAREVTAERVPAGLVMLDQALVNYPQSVTFQLELQPGHTIEEARLTFSLDKRSCLPVGTEAAARIDADSAEWQWAMVRSGNPPPGAELEWAWILTDTDGNSYATIPQSLTFTDERFHWQHIEEDGLRVSWYEGQEVGAELLAAAIDAREQLEGELGITLDDLVQFFIYGNAADMREAVLYSQDWAGGIAFTEYSTILMGVEPELVESWGLSAVRHELAHIAVDRFAWSCVGGRRPTWLNEGLAVYAEGEPDDQQIADIAHGIENDAFVPLRSLNGAFPAHDSAAGLAYSQSYSVVEYLLSTYGAERMRALLTTLAEGAGYDEALEATYGFNVDGLEHEWRAAIGAPARTMLPTPTAVRAELIPTVVPLSGGQPRPTPSESESAPATGVGPLFCGAPAFPLLLLGLGLSRRRLARRRSL